MSKPKHRRCETCNVVTARYARTQSQGPFVFKVWVRDARNGEVQVGYERFYCTAHAPTQEA